MGRELSPAELDELLPAYALAALDDDERVQVERYVQREPAARDEVESLREAASLLPYPSTGVPPSLWNRIESSLAEGPSAAGDPPVPRAVLGARRLGRPRRRRHKMLLTGAVVVAVVAITTSALLGVQVAHQQSRIDRLATLMHHDTMSNQAEAAKLVPGAHTVMLASTGASHTAEIVMLPDGSGYLMHADLPRLASGHTYQLWAETGPQDAPRMISAGVLGRNPGVTAFRVTVPIIGFEVTDEANPGAQIPSPTPVVAGQMS